MNAKQRAQRARMLQNARIDHEYASMQRDAYERTSSRATFAHARANVRDTCARLFATRDETGVAFVVCCMHFQCNETHVSLCEKCLDVLRICRREYSATLTRTRSRAFAIDDAYCVAYARGFRHEHARQFAMIAHDMYV